MDAQDRIDQPRRPDRDQEARIEELKRQAQEAAGGNMVCGEFGDVDGSVLEAFWERIVAVENAAVRSVAEPEDEIPPHRDPPSDRDRQLPAPPEV